MISDLHIHSRFSRACSKNIDFENLVKWAKIKGLDLLGTGDFTHPVWLQEIKDKLKSNGKGFYSYMGFPFIISGEVSLIYTQDRGRRIHLVVLVPSIEIAEKINSYFDTKGRRDYDGRPIFKIPGDEFVKEMMKISKDIEIIPAHCLVPDSFIHTKDGLKKIKEINIGEFVLTHKGRYQIVKNIYNRQFSGEIIEIVPACMKVGTFFTPEHPIYSIKTYKNCKNVFHTICKPTCAYLKRGCKNKAFKNYKPQWRQIKELEKGDVILYPRYKVIKDKSFILLSKFVSKGYLDEGYLRPRYEKVFVKNVPVKNKIEISKEFCRLVGYYLAEGYCSKDYIAFTFHEKEVEYIKDVEKLLRKAFGPFLNISVKKEKSRGVSIFVYSKLLKEFFENFHCGKPYKSYNKVLPSWFLDLPSEKLKELVIGWWRGDGGGSTSANLFNQFKQIFLKLGIIPSINKITAESVNKRREILPNQIGKRKITAKKDYLSFNILLFFENCGMINLPEFKKFKTKLNRRKGWIDNDYIYLPIIKINKKGYSGKVYNLEVEEDNSYLTENLTVHNCWTPWFGIFGSMSGFDSLKECFKEEFDNVHAIETGMSSTPDMNWRIQELENKSIISFSDAHSFWPFRLGREATIFRKCDSYKELIRQIRENDFIATIETFAEYGKYHWDGHRLCDFSSPPNKTKELNRICPVCKKQLTLGVENRVEELAGNPAGFKFKNSKPFYKLLPLHELIALIKGGNMQSKKVWATYNELIKKFGDEFNILLNVSRENLIKADVDAKLIGVILRNRKGNIKVKPGFDGIYGTAELGESQKDLSKFL